MKLPKYVKRPLYLSRITPFVDKAVIKVIVGQRRVGKSYLLYQLIDKISIENGDAHIVYLNKEDLAFSFIKNGTDLHNYVHQNKGIQGKTYVFIDEIQDIENFESSLRSLVLDTDLDIYCTGSNANLLAKDVAGRLSGRTILFSVFSLTYQEFLNFNSLEDSDEALERYLRHGGLPFLINLENDDDVVFEYLRNIYSTIIYRDIINRYALRNTNFLEQLVLYLASSTGSLFSAKSISDYLKSQKLRIAPNQVQIYLSHLCDAFIVHRVKRFDITGKRIFEFGEKFYFEDVGIRNALWGFREGDRGKLMENVVHNYLVSCGFVVYVGSLGKLEIDFVAEKQRELIYIQVALRIESEKTLEREIGNLLKIDDNFPKILVTFDAFEGSSYDGIRVMSLRTFLMSKW